MLLDVNIPVKEDVTCCFCQREFHENLNEHESNCGDLKGLDWFDKRTKILEKYLDRLKYQHFEVFCKLMFNEPVPVKQSRITECATCQTYEEHLQGKCLIVDKVVAFNIVTENMRTEELRIKYEYIDLKFEKVVSMIKQNQVEEMEKIEEIAEQKLSQLDKTKMSPRSWRAAKRAHHHDLIELAYSHEKNMKKFIEHTTLSKKYNFEAIEESVDTHIERARILLRMTEHFIAPHPSVRFQLSEKKEEEIEGEEEVEEMEE